MELINNYNNALQELYDHVGFVEDWTLYPIADHTDLFWTIHSDEIRSAKTADQVGTGHGYVSYIHFDRFYKKSIFEGKDFTMIFDNPQVDGMIWFSIFDNSKKI